MAARGFVQVLQILTMASGYLPMPKTRSAYLCAPSIICSKAARLLLKPPPVPDCRLRATDPTVTTTAGVGMLIRDAVNRGAKRIVLGLGGSATNDCGVGMASELDFRFLDKNNNSFVPVGGTLIEVEHIVAPKKTFCVPVVAACDVTNPLFGVDGAAYVFAPQKGADYMMVKDLDDGLKHYASVIKRDVGVDVENLKGGGAAGGIAAGMVAFFNAKLTSGIDVMLDGTGFDSLLKDAAFVVTGEGKLDNQTLDGKAISGLTRHAKKFGVPVIAICGQIAMGFDLEKSGLALATATSPENTPLLPSRNYKQELYDAAVKLFKNLLEKKS